jgi:hypothetical protein
LILIFSKNTNCESMAYRSFNFTSFKLEVSEKLPQGLTPQATESPFVVPATRKGRLVQSRLRDTVKLRGHPKALSTKQSRKRGCGQGNDLGHSNNDKDAQWAIRSQVLRAPAYGCCSETRWQWVGARPLLKIESTPARESACPSARQGSVMARTNARRRPVLRN